MSPPAHPVIAALAGARAVKERVATAKMPAELENFFMDDCKL
jgi:hypothetical protein